jgi:energy-coupling factor transporter ATP-binding protein EcfA2
MKHLEEYMATYIKRIEAYGIHNRFNVIQNFEPGVNILYGKNGTGKTTILHILTNILRGDYDRFAFLLFKEIRIALNDNSLISINSYTVNNDRNIEVSIDGTTISYFNVKEVTTTELKEGSSLVLRKIRNPKPLLSIAYFPAFRTMIEAWSSIDPASIGRYRTLAEYYDESYHYRSRSDKAKMEQSRALTLFSRKSFGRFVPRIDYPSPLEIEEILNQEIQRARLRIAETEQKLLSQAFLQTFSTLSKDHLQIQDDPATILEQIKDLSEEIEESSIQTDPTPTIGFIGNLRSLLQDIQVDEDSLLIAARVLNVYRGILQERASAQKKALQGIEKYLGAVNEFLENKKLEIHPDVSGKYLGYSVVASFEDGTHTRLQSLSSGERQIITLLYATTYMSSQEVVLVDEPEISLHVDWQRLLLNKMAEQMRDRQIIACTHSPFISADYIDTMKEVNLAPYHEIHDDIGHNHNMQMPLFEEPFDNPFDSDS